MTPAAPTEDLAAVADSEARLLTRVAGLRDDEVRGPSELPGWTRGHVLTHLARNADSLRRVVEARLRGEFVDQYAGGRPARAAAIEEGAARPAAALLADLANAVEWLHDTWASVPEDAWALETRLNEHTTRTVAQLVESRWREVEVHHLDLDLGYQAADWPPAFVARFLPKAVEGIDDRAALSPATGSDEGPPDRTWVIWADDLEMAWVIQTAAGVAVVTPLDEEFPDVMVRGSASGLLAWLHGRRTPRAAGLKVTGDASLATRLPGWFPYS